MSIWICLERFSKIKGIREGLINDMNTKSGNHHILCALGSDARDGELKAEGDMMGPGEEVIRRCKAEGRLTEERASKSFLRWNWRQRWREWPTWKVQLRYKKRTLELQGTSLLPNFGPNSSLQYLDPLQFHFLKNLLFPFKTKFYWSIFALQCCISFYGTAKWVSHMQTYIPSCLDFLPI